MNPNSNQKRIAFGYESIQRYRQVNQIIIESSILKQEALSSSEPPVFMSASYVPICSPIPSGAGRLTSQRRMKVASMMVTSPSPSTSLTSFSR